MRQGRGSNTPSICRTCGAFEVLATAVQCRRCWDRSAAALGAAAEARVPVVPSPPSPPSSPSPARSAADADADERWRELWARREADARHPERGAKHETSRRTIDDSIDTWFERQRGPGLCWFCHRRPGLAAHRGACEECFGRHQPAPHVPVPPVVPLAGLHTPEEIEAIRNCPTEKELEMSATQTPGGAAPAVNGDRLQAIKDAHERVKAKGQGGRKPNLERQAKAREIIQRLGPDATYAQIDEAMVRECGQKCRTNTICEIKRELWPDAAGRRSSQPRQSKAQAPAPAVETRIPVSAPSALPAQATPTPAPAPAATPAIDGIQAISDAVAWCGGWGQFKRLVDAIEKLRSNP